MESILTTKDSQGIPMNLGNRHERRALAKINRTKGIDADAHARFEKEPVWRAMERLMKTMKAWYGVNGAWVFSDPNAMAVLNDMRKDHEKREDEIRAKVAEALVKEQEKLSETFARVEDKKILQNQLKSMREEWAMLQKLSAVRTAEKKNHG